MGNYYEYTLEFTNKNTAKIAYEYLCNSQEKVFYDRDITLKERQIHFGSKGTSYDDYTKLYDYLKKNSKNYHFTAKILSEDELEDSDENQTYEFDSKSYEKKLPTHEKDQFYGITFFIPEELKYEYDFYEFYDFLEERKLKENTEYQYNGNQLDELLEKFHKEIWTKPQQLYKVHNMTENISPAEKISYLLDQGLRFENESKTKAIKLYKEAVKLGSNKAMYRIAQLNDDLFSTEKQKAEAQKWYVKAAENGYFDSILKLIKISQNKDDYEKWVGEAEKYTSNESADVISRFADLLFRHKDIDRAKKWYEASYNKGYKESKNQLEIIDLWEQHQANKSNKTIIVHILKKIIANELEVAEEKITETVNITKLKIKTEDLCSIICDTETLFDISIPNKEFWESDDDFGDDIFTIETIQDFLDICIRYIKS